MRKVPLPVRDGLNPSRVRLPETGHWRTTLDYLRQRFAGDEDRLLEKVAALEVVDVDGRPIDDETPFVADSFIFLYRDPPVEKRIPFEIEILHRDDDLLVIDKPHFLATMPRGAFIAESAVVRLRREFDLPDLSPVHRLDRGTAGVVMFSLKPEQRGSYQTLFARRLVRKHYEAVARFDAALALPVTVSSRIVKERGTPTAEEVPGEPNSHTRVELLASRGEVAGYGLDPSTGKTHQLRVHLSSIGIPILNDHFYPRLYEVPMDDFSAPLQLLARWIEFADPFTGELRHFESQRRLAHWPDHPTRHAVANMKQANDTAVPERPL